MCLIACAWRAHPDYELLLAANRDEFHQRPTLAAAAWSETPTTIGGRDGLQGGGWLALSARRRLAAVTNVRRMEPPAPDTPSRGRLVAEFVNGDLDAATHADRLLADAGRYAGFNLLLWDGSALLYLSNHPAPAVHHLAPGIHAVSNAQLDTPWPKLLRLRNRLEAVCAGNTEIDALWPALADDRPAAEAELPDTGVGLETERFLSSPFIRGPHYGTRASTLVAIPGDGSTMRLTERRFGPDGVAAGDSALTLP